MKHLVFLVLVLFAFPVVAQPKQPAKPAAQETKPAPEPAKQATAPAAGPKKPRRWNEDARHCLERGSNTEIIKCAEEFL